MPIGHREIVSALAKWPRDFPRSDRDRWRAEGWTIIEPGTAAGSAKGFHGREWERSSFLAERDGVIQISLIVARRPGTGAFSRLLNRLEASGSIVRVVEPMPLMQAMLARKGFSPSHVGTSFETRYTVWARPAKEAGNG